MASPEQRLWCAVLCQAVYDANYRGAQKSGKLDKRRARTWAAVAGEDFREVCDLAGMNAEAMREGIVWGGERVQAALREGVVRERRPPKRRWGR